MVSEHVGPIQAQAAYDEAERKNIWDLTVSEARSQKMGFRAYYSYVIRSLERWGSAGDVFLSAAGFPLSLEALKADDLGGFWGRKGSQGPSRKIAHEKVAILDLYVRRRRIEREGKLTDFTASERFAEAISEFMELIRDWVPDVSLWRGMYIAELDFDKARILRSLRLGEPLRLVIPVIVLADSRYANHCRVHRIEVPMKPEFLPDGIRRGSDWEKIDRFFARSRPPQTALWSGIGIYGSRRKILDGFSIAYITKNSITSEPYIGNFEVHLREDDDEIDGYRPDRLIEIHGNNYGIQYIYCGRDNFMEYNVQYSRLFFDNLMYFYRSNYRHWDAPQKY